MYRLENYQRPTLALDLNNGYIKIQGKSIMVHPQEFYPSVIDLIKKYCENPNQETKLVIDLVYYNSLSKRYLLKIVELISRIELKRNHEVKILWYYDPEDYCILEDIKLFSKIIHFRIKAVEHILI